MNVTKSEGTFCHIYNLNEIIADKSADTNGLSM